ncbi:MAG: DUF4935 domain-containing protein [Sphingopyxis sp.]|nr:DUF4935 domain-containing protein [Sphingopyxis sp.]
MPYDALTIDTSSFMRLGLNLETGLLAQLSQFHDGPTALILSEIVTREILKHLAENGRKARDSALAALDRIEQLLLVEGGGLEHAKAAAAAMGDSRAVARQRLTTFVETCGAETIPAALCSTDDVLKLYFNSAQPFEASGTKKHEFPDAIALLSLEKWAADNQKTILAISADKGWAAYAETSDRIDVEADLAKALEIVQEHAETAESAVANYLSLIETGKLPDAASDIEHQLRSSLAAWDYHAEAHSDFYFEVETWELDLDNYVLLKSDNDFNITIVRVGSGVTVARVAAKFTARAKADFSLSNWDSYDKDYVSLGRSGASREVVFEGAFLLSLKGDLAEDPEEIYVDRAEVVDAIDEVDFGEIGLDPSFYDDDYADYEAFKAEDAKADLEAEIAANLAHFGMD